MKNVLIFTIPLFLFCSCTIGEKQNKMNKMNKNEIKQKLEKDLPVGSSLNKIITYLQSYNLESSYVEKENKIYAKIEKEKKLFMHKNISVIFLLDDNKKLLSFKLKEEYTGL